MFPAAATDRPPNVLPTIFSMLSVEELGADLIVGTPDHAAATTNAAKA